MSAVCSAPWSRPGSPVGWAPFARPPCCSCAGPSALLVAAPTDADHSYLTSLGLLLVGAAVVAGNVIRGTWRQRYVPAHLLARVVTTMQVVNYGAMPLAGLAAGALGTHVGVRPAMLLLAGVHALASTSILTTRIGRNQTLPPPRL